MHEKAAHPEVVHIPYLPAEPLVRQPVVPAPEGYASVAGSLFTDFFVEFFHVFPPAAEPLFIDSEYPFGETPYLSLNIFEKLHTSAYPDDRATSETG